jgi:hypothetical protein
MFNPILSVPSYSVIHWEHPQFIPYIRIFVPNFIQFCRSLDRSQKLYFCCL